MLLGADLSGIRVHSGPTSTELNDRIQAKAFTTGNDIYFRDSVPDVSTSTGQELLTHELTHTIQQGAAPLQRHMTLQRHIALRSSTGSVQRSPWSKKKKGAPVIGSPTGAQVNGSDIGAALAPYGASARPVANPQVGFGGPMGVGGARKEGWSSQPSASGAPGEPAGRSKPKTFKRPTGGAAAEFAKPAVVGAAAGAARGVERVVPLSAAHC